MTYWRLFYHLVWTTKNREPLIDDKVEPILFKLLKREARQLDLPFMEVGGTVDHMHVLTAIPPKLRISDVVKQLKGATSHYLTQRLGIPFAWQRGYGIVGVTEQALPQVERYIKEQKERHREDRLIDKLERRSKSIIEAWQHWKCCADKAEAL
jgi:putative transposase